jgi:hypothetical protein
MDVDDILVRLRTLRSQLDRYSRHDKEQEVAGIALPVLDELLSQARRLVPAGDPVLDRMQDVVSADSIAAGEPVRAIDALLVTDQVITAIEHHHHRGARHARIRRLGQPD